MYFHISNLGLNPKNWCNTLLLHHLHNPPQSQEQLQLNRPLSHNQVQIQKFSQEQEKPSKTGQIQPPQPAMPPRTAPSLTTAPRLPPLPKLRVRRANKAETNPCVGIMSSVLGCWASSGYSVTGCAELEKSLRECMDVPVCFSFCFFLVFVY